ncbi:MAG: molybdopterin dinucleotide binding domain-containing protein, partial [Halobacteria archaeon]|nr:molybdopterin dinucleotide binding domain-containing protein [Halobacteria archaeon]
NQHRGEPHMFISRKAAEDKGIEDGDYVRVYNNYGEAKIQVKVSSQPADDQVIFYHAWDPYLYEGGKGLKDLIPGLVNPMHFAGGYGHLKYRFVNWQQQQINRHVCVDFEPV